MPRGKLAKREQKSHVQNEGVLKWIGKNPARGGLADGPCDEIEIGGLPPAAEGLAEALW
jgi:hypothetical protein